VPYVRSRQVRLYYEDVGGGPPVVFVHELASDVRQWRGTIDALSGRFRCIAYNARGYPPSEVPDQPEAYRWDAFAADVGAVLDQLGLEHAALVGWSMGAYAALQFARLHSDRVRALALVGVGSGSPAGERAGFQAQMQALALAWRTHAGAAAAMVAATPGRQAFRRRRPEAFAAWLEDLEGHSPDGMALTCANYQALRPSLEEFEDQLARLPMPVLLTVGEEDAPCLVPTRRLAEVIPRARLQVLPDAGHMPMLEDPDSFVQALEAFLEGL
jgi:pimeloyl-ACP methyl ester carboxylesterase